ncbi:hypothetical protein SAMN05216344_102182 [Polaromonas sp. OV174]|uniref:hypothetical protein n=1 Tax=Polaromonas sp. OV174 TaxID=1855300 RepID=UPI0008E86F2D|nr:hypothetical protein [Polaromonas sp. OV174]SFB74331.1 hypothetical protein SAMN05216344_102182 [Polaromonas sp. OV174]
MGPIQHATNNGVLGAPPDFPLEDCRALPVTHTEVDGVPCVLSFWMPDAEDLALLNAGKAVVLAVQGRTHAPLSVGVEA